MSATHTPGPWSRGGQWVSACGRLEVASVRIGTRDNWNDAEGEANASLIAAAPDLLAALRDCAAALRTAKAYHKGRPPWVKTDEAALEAADAAIDKATTLRP